MRYAPLALVFTAACSHSPDDEERLFLMALAQEGCVVDNDATAARIEAKTGFSKEVLRDLVVDLMQRRVLVDSDTGGVRSVVDECAERA
ncbi:hypothetical protein [Yoonia sp. 2307UL14-13]|uniref:hypothetical protein n=1 Tax=Yoonia sp. 2307UL14-13 TaxID=3126506 RepID=UPI0030B52F86